MGSSSAQVLKTGTLDKKEIQLTQGELKVPMLGLAQGKEGRSQLASEGQLELEKRRGKEPGRPDANQRPPQSSPALPSSFCQEDSPCAYCENAI